MKALFTGFLTVSISTSLMIGIVLLLRLIFKKAPKALICGVWALVILRLLLPFQIPLEFSLRPKTPVFTQASTAVVDQQQVYEQTEIPPFVPVQEQGSFFPTVVIDYMQIAAYVWCIGLTAMLGYMVFTYLRMKYLLRESVKRGEGVYENGALPTAFLLGYIRPRIYLPTGMSNETAELVIRHERAHLRRGDNWLKLVAYICLATHWYNPAVWLMYLLLCRDIEGACDESVIRTLDVQGRGDYSAALLSCGKGKPNFAGCPVAFGEVSIGQRIRNVLNYKKPTLWICIILAAVMIFAAVFFLTDPVKPVPPHYNTLSQMIGQPISVVCDKLGIDHRNLILVDFEETPNILFPETVEYQGTDFQIKLYPNYYTREGQVGLDKAALVSFEYICEFDLRDAKTAASASLRAGNSFLDIYGDPEWNWTGGSTVKLVEATEEKLVKLYGHKRDKGNYMVASWDLTDSLSTQVIEYFYEYKEINPLFVARKNIFHEFNLLVSTGCDTLTNKLYLKLTYEVGVHHGVRTTPYKQLYREDAIPEVYDPVALNTSNAEETLVSLIGLDKKAVCEALGISEYDIYRIDTGAGEIYQAPNEVEYYGLDFVLILSFTNEGYLQNAQLLREYEEVTEQYARDIVNVVQAQKGVAGSIPSEEWQAHTVDESRFAMFLVKTLEDSYNEGYVWYLNTPADEKSSESDEVYYGGLSFKHYVTWYRDADEDVIQLRVGWLVD